ncbi:MAG: ACP S-malonyltransferase, partial [Bacteroidetes bacterium]|nr:ACP S-malonyltransferase [Bacteroidota bacterium]
DLKETKVTQPSVFLHSVIRAKMAGDDFRPDMVAGHSLGEFSALVANGALDFASGLQLVYKRALAMQQACEQNPGTMAAIVGLDDAITESICQNIDDVVVPANYNCPGQLVISGSMAGVETATAKLTEAGAKRAIIIAVGGAFHSPLMKQAEDELAAAIEATSFRHPACPIYQNVDAKPHLEPADIKANLIKQLTAPVRWTAIM